ncbi:putative transposable element [Trichonephila clavipes]|nr:putative transposable element [Trichonephila clavipes]
MYYSIDVNFFNSKHNLVALHFKYDQARRRFVELAQNEIAVVSDFHERILFSDEAHFWLNGYVNKQNCRIWSEANPQVYVETPLHPEKLTVWCALWTSGIIGPYFFKNAEGHNVTVNGDRYRAMITNFFIPELNNHNVQELWFQQDGATCHTARVTIDLLKDTLSLVYADKTQTLDHLEDNIRSVVADIRPQMLEKVIENWTSRLDYIRASRGSPMPEIIFKMWSITGREPLELQLRFTVARSLVKTLAQRNLPRAHAKCRSLPLREQCLQKSHVLGFRHQYLPGHHRPAKVGRGLQSDGGGRFATGHTFAHIPVHGSIFPTHFTRMLCVVKIIYHIVYR